MHTYNFYSGEPIQTGSPPFNSQYQNQFNFVNNNQMPFNGGLQDGMINLGNGFNSSPSMISPYRQQFMGPFQQQAYQEPVYQDRVVHVPGIFSVNDMILSEDIERVCQDLQMEMEIELEKSRAERQQRFQGMFNNNPYQGYNYYGMNYYQDDNTIIQKYRLKIEKIREEGIRKRNEYNRNLIKMTYNYNGIEISDEELDKLCYGYTYTVPGIQVRYEAENANLSKLVECDTSKQYREHFNQVREYYQKMFETADSSDMQGFLQSQGIIKTMEIYEEEVHNRRNGQNYYNNSSYRRLLAQKVMERDGKDIGIDDTKQDVVGKFLPTFSSVSDILEDGTVNIRVPENMGGATVVYNNQLESMFLETRNKFLQSIYEQDNMNDTMPVPAPVNKEVV